MTAKIPRIALVLATLLTAAACTAARHDGPTPVPTSGGTVASHDGSVRVAFGPGAVDPGTKVAVATGGDGPPPPIAVDPLDRPFDVEVPSGHARTGAVTVKLALPAGIPANS